MVQVSIHDAKTHLSRLIQACLTGETVVIARGKVPLVQLVPLQPTVTERRIGGRPGLVVAMADDFDAPLADFAEYTR